MCQCSQPSAPPSSKREYESLLSELLAGEYEDVLRETPGGDALSERTFFSNALIGFKRPEVVKGKVKGPDRNETAVFWPRSFNPAKPVDIVIYFHGLLGGFPGRGSSIRTYLGASDPKKSIDLRLREEVEASGKNVLLIVPYMGDSVTHELMTTDDRFGKYLEALLADITANVLRPNFSVSKMKRGRMILAGHSAGGKVLLRLAKKYPFDEVWGFDSIYQGGEQSGWTAIASNNPKSKIVFYYNYDGNISDSSKNKNNTFNALHSALEKDKKRTVPRLANMQVIDVKKDAVRGTIMNGHFKMLRPALKECLQGLAEISSGTEWENEYEEEYEEGYLHESEEGKLNRATTLLQEIFSEYEDVNSSPVPFKDVPFAPLPQGECYWPLISSHPDQRLISYQSAEGLIGTEGRFFGAYRRSSGGRYHAAIDMHANNCDPVVAIEDGVIVRHSGFCCEPVYTTYSLLVRHSNVVVNYGEVGPQLAAGLKVGSTVKAGQVIGYVGKNPKGSSMLHFEIYTVDSTKNAKWLRTAKKAPANLYNPTLYLLHLKANGKTAIQDPMAFLPERCVGPKFSSKKAIAANNKLAKKLGWAPRYMEIRKLIGINFPANEQYFVQIVARWQKAKGIQPADGIINAATWKKMQEQLYFLPVPAKEYDQPPMIDVPRAVSRNKVEARKQKWQYNRETIAAIIGLPAGSSDAEFALAVAKWQAANLPGKPDGIVGPGTWRALQKQFGDNGFVRKGKKHGWKIFGGVPIKTTLCRLVREGKLTMSNTEIEMLRLVSANETGGFTSAVNSWDDSFMTMGFTQHTIKSGQLQDLIDTEVEAFKKYGIEIDGVYEGTGTRRIKATRRIKGTTRREDLHDIKWAHVFYKAGLDDKIIAAEAKIALKKLTDLRIDTDPTGYLQQFNGIYPNLWAYIYECNNAMPTPFAEGLRKAIVIAKAKNIKDPVALADIIRAEAAKEVKKHFTDDPPKYGTVDGKVKKMDNIYDKMKAGSKTTLDNTTYCN